MNKWDKRFIKLAEHISFWSKDPSTKCGSVIVDNDNRIVSVGFNGYPKGVPDDDLDDRTNKYAKVIHGEVNSILFSKCDIKGYTMYVWPMPPCSHCASVIIQSGISRVVTKRATEEQNERWGDLIKITEDMFKKASVKLEYFS